MGVKNFLIEGVSCAGKTSVCNELEKRGYQSIHGDDVLAYWGAPETGQRLDNSGNAQWIWDIEKVKAFVADQDVAITFFCGGCRNSRQFIGLFDDIFVLEIDMDTLNQRLAQRPADQWGGTASQGEAFARLQQKTKIHLPKTVNVLDATLPLAEVVDELLERANI